MDLVKLPLLPALVGRSDVQDQTLRSLKEGEAFARLLERASEAARQREVSSNESEEDGSLEGDWLGRADDYIAVAEGDRCEDRAGCLVSNGPASPDVAVWPRGRSDKAQGDERSILTSDGTAALQTERGRGCEALVRQWPYSAGYAAAPRLETEAQSSEAAGSMQPWFSGSLPWLGPGQITIGSVAGSGHQITPPLAGSSPETLKDVMAMAQLLDGKSSSPEGRVVNGNGNALPSAQAPLGYGSLPEEALQASSAASVAASGFNPPLSSWDTADAAAGSGQLSAEGGASHTVDPTARWALASLSPRSGLGLGDGPTAGSHNSGTSSGSASGNDAAPEMSTFASLNVARNAPLGDDRHREMSNRQRAADALALPPELSNLAGKTGHPSDSPVMLTDGERLELVNVLGREAPLSFQNSDLASGISAGDNSADGMAVALKSGDALNLAFQALDLGLTARGASNPSIFGSLAAPWGQGTLIAESQDIAASSMHHDAGGAISRHDMPFQGAAVQAVSLYTVHGRDATQSSPAQQIAWSIQNSDLSGVELLLQPEELGAVRIALQQDGEVLRVVVQAERAETLDLLRRSSADLQLALLVAGHASTSFSFQRSDTSDHGTPSPKSQEFLAERAPSEPELILRRLSHGRLDLRL